MRVTLCLASLLLTTRAAAQDEPGHFSGLARITCASGAVGYAAALNDDLPTPGYENRWRVVLAPDVPIACLGQQAMETIVLVTMNPRGSYSIHVGGWGSVELVPGRPEVREACRRAAPAAEARRQVVSLRAVGDGVEILIEERRR